jgi:hypothetical protein
VGRNRFAMRRPRPVVLIAGLTLLAAVAAGCDGAARTPAATATAAAPTGQAGTRAAGSGTVTGRATYANGTPLSGAMVTAIASEYAIEIGAQTGQDGTYGIQLGEPEANYRVVAWLERDYNGRRYHVPLAPEGATDTSFFGRDGRTQNFVWQMTGKAPWGAHLQPDNSRHYIGGSIDVYVYDPNTDPTAQDAIQAPAGATIEITLTPSGPLIDGTQGETLEESVTLEEETGPLSLLSVGTIVDVPVGRYDVTARLVRPGESPVDLAGGATCDTTGCPLRPPAPAPTATVEFWPFSTPIRPFQRNPYAGVQLYVVEP